MDCPGDYEEPPRRPKKRARQRPAAEVAVPRSLPVARPLTVWTDCSGMECPLWALRYLNVDYVHLQACDVDPIAERFFRAHFPESTAIYNRDIRTRRLPEVPAGSIDVYCSGFPCPTFSIAGAGAGVQDERGQIIVYIIRTLTQLLPKTFLLENVGGLWFQHRDALRWILEELNKIDSGRYTLEMTILNSKDHGLPHSRSRLWIVGVDRRLVRPEAPFRWPPPVGHAPLELILDPRTREATVYDMPPETQTTARSNFMEAFRKVAESLRIDPLRSEAVVDVDSSTSRGPHWMNGVVPCLTRARSGQESHWILNRGRRMNVYEAVRLMGIQSSHIVRGTVTENQLGHLLGNGMSVHVLERLLRQILSAAQIVPLSRMTARWESIDSARESAVSLST